MYVSADQIRAARALLRLDQAELARRANVSVVTIRRVEAPENKGQVGAGTLENVVQALRAAGAEFVHAGVRRREQTHPDAEARLKKLIEISERSAQRLRGHEMLTDDDMYDEDGLPY